MKKVIMSALLIGLLATSCKNAKEETTKAVENATETTEKAVEKAADATKEAATKVVEKAEEAVAEAAESVVNGVTIPDFKDDKVEEHLKNYAAYAEEYIAGKGDVVKNASLAKKGVELANKGAEIVKSLDADEAKKFNGVMAAIQSKMAPAKK